MESSVPAGAPRDGRAPRRRTGRGQLSAAADGERSPRAGALAFPCAPEPLGPASLTGPGPRSLRSPFKTYGKKNSRSPAAGYK